MDATSSVSESTVVDSLQCTGTSSVSESAVVDSCQYDTCVSSVTGSSADSTCQQENLTEALCNLLTDIDVETYEVIKDSSKSARTILKGLQAATQRKTIKG